MNTANTSISKVNRAWAIIACTALTIAISVKTYKNYTRTKGDVISESTRPPPGAFAGESTVKRRSPYEGAGNSYLGRKGGDRFA